jgi:hypothetical protein
MILCLAGLAERGREGSGNTAGSPISINFEPTCARIWLAESLLDGKIPAFGQVLEERRRNMGVED